ncbi:MAG TPA: Ig-like domain-containing protein [Gemmatimonadales bacterium]
MRVRALAALIGAAMAVGCGDATAPTGVERSGSSGSVTLVASVAELRAEIGVPVPVPVKAVDGSGREIPADEIEWRVGDLGMAVVDDGVLYALREGTTTVSASVAGRKASMVVAAYGDVRLKDVAIDRDTLVVEPGETAVLTAIVSYSNGGRVAIRPTAAWRSEDTGVARVSNGEVTAVSPGVTRVLARFGDQEDSAIVMVAGAEPEAPVVTPVAPPTPLVSDIDVQLVRFDGGSGEVIVSNGVPLAPGALRPGQTGRVRLVIDGVERKISVTELAGRHLDGSLRSILVQARLSFGAAERPTGRLTLSSERPAEFRMVPELTMAVPPAVVLPSSPDYLVSTDLVGQTITVEQSKALGSPFTRYESDFVKYADQHWTNKGAYWGENYYDRALIYYAFWVRSGNPEYWRRASELALSYRRDYLEKNSHGSSPHWSQLEGLEKHYLLTGDEASRYAIAQVAGSAFNYWITRLDRVNLANFESRIQARVLQAHLLAWRLDAKGTRDKDWGALLPSLLDQILSTQQADGSYRFLATCHESLNYMSGMLNDVLASYHTYYRADPRIVDAVRRNVDWLWSTQWLPGSRAFKYISAPCEGVGEGGAAPDLNLMFVTGPAWVYGQTGDSHYRDMADQIFSGGVTRGNLHGSKQFNENYYASFKYLAYRQ